MGLQRPASLAGEAIPLVGCIDAVADVLDALLSERPYMEAWSLEATLEYMNSQSGKHFDPALITVLPSVLPDILRIKSAFADAHGAQTDLEL